MIIFRYLTHRMGIVCIYVLIHVEILFICISFQYVCYVMKVKQYEVRMEMEVSGQFLHMALVSCILRI